MKKRFQAEQRLSGQAALGMQGGDSPISAWVALRPFVPSLDNRRACVKRQGRTSSPLSVQNRRAELGTSRPHPFHEYALLSNRDPNIMASRAKTAVAKDM
jgi:hypothetical protein